MAPALRQSRVPAAEAFPRLQPAVGLLAQRLSCQTHLLSCHPEMASLLQLLVPGLHRALFVIQQRGHYSPQLSFCIDSADLVSGIVTIVGSI